MSNLHQDFFTPANQYRPRLRYWFPGGYAANYLEEIDSEIKSIAEAGFGGVEISDVYDGLSESAFQVLQPEEYGFTSENWKETVKQVMRSARKYGIKVDLTIGPHWPATTNEANPNEEGTAKEVVYGTHHFTGILKKGTSVTTLCPPHYKTNDTLHDGGEIISKLVGVFLAEHISHSEIEMPPAVPWEQSYTVMSDEVTFQSLKDISDKICDSKLMETIEPMYQKNILIVIYQRGTAQRVNMFSMAKPSYPDVMAPYAYVVDHFSKKGAGYIRSLWEKNFLVDEEFRNLLQETGDCFFEDSLELQSVGHWTDHLLEEFEKRMGYSIKPYLPFVLGINQDKGLSIETASFQVEKIYQKEIVKFRHDYYQVLNQLYQEYHLGTVKEWINELRMNYRVQPYGWAIDSAKAGAIVDVVEGESLGFGEDGNDAFRMLAAGRDFGGIKVLSDEAGAYLFQGYATTLPQLFSTLHKNYMAGVNQTYWHGFPFRYAPQAKWPGFAAFTPMMGGRGFAEPWGERQPIWQYLKPYTTYLARVHQLLRYGKNQVDVLIYQAGHNATEHKQTGGGDFLTKLGYNYQIMTEGLFDLPVKISKTGLSVAGGSYSVLAIFEGTYLTPAVAKKITEWEESGLKVVYLQEDSDGTELTEILGISDFANESGELLTYRRLDEKNRFVFCYNQGSEEIELSKYLENKRLVEWSAWLGEVVQIQTSILQPHELRIFEELNQGNEFVVSDLLAGSLQIRSLKNQPWHLTLEKWVMFDEGCLGTKKEVIEIDLEKLTPWSQLSEFKDVSGVGTYITDFKLGEDYPTQLVINVSNSLSVKLNGTVLSGNLINGYLDIPKKILKADNHLEITVASTLNNYLNNCSLTDYYGNYEAQIYGIEDVALRFKK